MTSAPFLEAFWNPDMAGGPDPKNKVTPEPLLSTQDFPLHRDSSPHHSEITLHHGPRGVPPLFPGP